ncbi:MAG TPA: ABC transporter ATP-binding protein [Gemmatales bacterium]|nr:ABC transporter ATP-binding protein [Gemmatales bacterium]HMP57805.1 ABC transporter ATP-binding protein [Gemmatales bacterium]
MVAPLLAAHDLVKSYRKHRIAIPVLRGLDLTVEAGSFVAVIGASGSGKSTLLHLLGVLDRPDGGQVFLDGERIDDQPAQRRDHLRNHWFGFIFQFYHLLPELSLLHNVAMPLMIRHSLLGWVRGRRQHLRAAEALIERVGLAHRKHHRPRELSGGEMQRAAIARALVARPRILLADEPTGNLDAAAGAEVMRLLSDLNRQDGVTTIMVTHNLEIAARADRVVKMAEGRLESSPLAA